jgi:hypothetical protein
MHRVYVALLSETLTEHLIATVTPPPRRAEAIAALAKVADSIIRGLMGPR